MMVNFLEKSPRLGHFGDLHTVSQKAKVVHFSSGIGRDCCYFEPVEGVDLPLGIILLGKCKR